MIWMKMKVSGHQLLVVDKVQCFVSSGQALSHGVDDSWVWMMMKMMLDK